MPVFTCGHGLAHAVTSVFGRVSSPRYCVTAGIGKDTPYRSSIPMDSRHDPGEENKIGESVGEDQPGRRLDESHGEW